LSIFYFRDSTFRLDCVSFLYYYIILFFFFFFFFSSRRRHTRLVSDWSSDVCSSDLCHRFFCAADSALGVLRPVHNDGGCDVRRRIRPGDDSDEQHEGEIFEGFASEEQQDGGGEEDGQRRQDRSGERLVDGDVHLLGKRHAPLRSELPSILPESVVGDDRVVHRIADDGQQRGQDGQGELTVRDGQRTQAHEDVVKDRDDGRHAALEVEPHRDVEHDPNEAGQHRVDGLQL